MSDANKAVFLSYASQDAEAAKRICDALRQAGVEVWFDQSELRGGDAWDAKIRKQIKECTLFVPVISANTQARAEGYFRLEWRLADRRTELMGKSKAFLLPVSIDGTGETNADVPDSFLAVQWTRMETDQESGAFVRHVQDLLGAGLRSVSGASGARTGLPPAEAPAPPANERSIAVLPFANMSADPENEYFCDGIAEEITGALSKVGQLLVAGRTSAFSFKGKSDDLRAIGRTLNVASVLEGSVRKAGDRLRITVQLVKVTDGYHLWSERYDRQMAAIFDIQDEIALAVVEALKVTLLGQEQVAVLMRSTNNPEAYQLCLKARHAWQRWTDEGFRTGVTLFNQALERDPSYALAHFGLGDCYMARDILGRDPIDLPKIRSLFETAIRLDPNLAEAHAVLGAIVNGLLEWNWSLAESRCLEAIRRDARSGHSICVYGLLLNMTGRLDEAATTIRRAIELDPLNPPWNTFLIQVLLAQRDWAGALKQTEVTLHLVPEYWYALQFAGQAHVALGQLNEAIAKFERAVTSSGEVPYIIGLLGNALAKAGRRDEARQQLAKLRLRAESHHMPAIALAYVHAGLDEWDEAFTLLEQSLDAHNQWLPYSLTGFPVLDDLRPDPRFKELVRRIGLSRPTAV